MPQRADGATSTDSSQTPITRPAENLGSYQQVVFVALVRLKERLTRRKVTKYEMQMRIPEHRGCQVLRELRVASGQRATHPHCQSGTATSHDAGSECDRHPRTFPRGHGRGCCPGCCRRSGGILVAEPDTGTSHVQAGHPPVARLLPLLPGRSQPERKPWIQAKA